MNIWNFLNWIDNFDYIDNSLNVCYDYNVIDKVKLCCVDFLSWLEREYTFPVPIEIRIKSDKRITGMDGDKCVWSFWDPGDPDEEPYLIKVATGDFYELSEEIGEYDALASIICSITEALTYYFFSINDEWAEENAKIEYTNDQAYNIVCDYLDEIEDSLQDTDTQNDDPQKGTLNDDRTP